MRQTHIKSKTLAVILSVMLAVTMAPFSVFANSTNEENDSYEASITVDDNPIYYDTVKEAVDAATDGQTIKLEKDVTASDDDSGMIWFLNKTGSYTFDCNGHTLNGGVTDGYSGGADITLKGFRSVETTYVKDETGAMKQFAAACCYGSNMTIEDGYFTATNAVTMQYGGTLEIEDGTYVMKGEDGPVVLSLGGETNVRGGTFKGTEELKKCCAICAAGTGVVNVHGGNFNGYLEKQGSGQIKIYGGVFDHDPSEFVAEGYEATQAPEGTWTVHPIQTEAVATLSKEGSEESTSYPTIAEAVEEWNNLKTAGEYTITIKDGTYTDADMVIEQATDTEIDGGEGGKYLTIKPESQTGKVTIKPESTYTGMVFLIDGKSNGESNSKVDIEGITFDLSLISKTCSATGTPADLCAVWFLSGGSGKTSPFDSKSDIDNVAHRYGHNVTVSNCEVLGDSTDGNRRAKIKLIGSADNCSMNNVTINNCHISDSCSIFGGYAANSKNDNGLIVKNSTATNCKNFINNQSSGNVTVENCSAQVYSDYVVRTNGIGKVTIKNSTLDNSACTASAGGNVVIRSRATDVEIINSVFIKKDGENFYHVQNGELEDGKQKNNTDGITIKEGSYLVDKFEEGKIEIGKLSSDKVINETDLGFNFENASTEVAQIGTTKYPSLAAAIEEVKNDETITMLANVVGAHGISVPSGKNFTVDFNGYSYSVEKPGAGSQNTKTQAFQLLKNSNITFKNGTISCTADNKNATWESNDTIKGVAMIIQNYADLTLDNMTIDGTNIAHNINTTTSTINVPAYVVSSNHGTVNIENGTKIITADKYSYNGKMVRDYAFDCYDGDDTSYPGKPIVNVSGNETEIIGKIEITGGTVNLKNGAVVNGQVRVGEYQATGDTYKGAKDGTLNIENGATVNNAGDYAVVVFGPNTANIAGTINGIVGTNGNPWLGGSVINVKEGAQITEANDVGIYMPNGTLNISGGEITGQTAVYFKSTNLNITGGKLTANGNHAEYDYTGNGCNPTGDALVIDSCNYPNGIDNVRVMGGYFQSTGDNTVAIKAITSQEGKEVTHFITGGHFSTDPSADNSNYVAEGKEVVNDTKANIDAGYLKTIAVASITAGESSTPAYYNSLSAAIAAVQNNQTITLLTDINDATGIEIKDNKTFTIDFAGHEYIVSKPGAGSTGTTNQAFHLENCNVTFMNGTIKCAADNLVGSTDASKMNIERLFQSYGTLTLKDMTLDGTNLYLRKGKANRAVVEAPNGILNITGSTSIIDKMDAEGAVASINVDTWKGPYPNGAVVTVNTTGKIGTIRCYTETQNPGTKEKNSLLTVENGKIREIIEVDGCVSGEQKDVSVVLKGGVYKNIPTDSAYYEEGKTAVHNTDEKTSADYPWTVGEEGKVIITTSSALLDKAGNKKEGVDHIANLTGGGQYEVGGNVTLKAPAVDNLKFVGWFDATGTKVSEKMEYTFQAPADAGDQAINYTAKYQTNEAEATVSVSKSGNAQEKGTVVVKKQAEETTSDTSKTVDVGEKVTLQATIDNSKAGVCYFIAWQNKNGAVLSTDMTYETTVLKSQEVEAVFLNEGAAIVNFNDEEGNLLKSGMFAASDAKTITAVAISKKGQTYTGWKDDNDEELQNEDVNKMIQTAADEATKRAIEGKGSALGTVNVKASYAPVVQYTVTLKSVDASGKEIGSPVSVTKNVGEAVVLIATENMGGLYFQGFKENNTSGEYITQASNKLSINPDNRGEYTYFAVYGSNQSTAEKLAVITLGEPYDASTSVPKIGLTMSWVLPEGATLVEAGFYYARSESSVSSIVIDGIHKFTTTLKGPIGSYTCDVNVTKFKDNEFGFAAYVKYKVGTGDSVTVIQGVSGTGGTKFTETSITNDFIKIKYTKKDNWKYNTTQNNN